MKLTYPPLLAFHEVVFLQHMLFGSILICVAVKGLYFHQDLEQKNKNKKVVGKVLKLCFSLRKTIRYSFSMARSPAKYVE